LAAQDPDAYEPDVALTCNKLAMLIENIKHYREVEPLFGEALELYRRLAAQNPGVYEPRVATTCYNLAMFQFNIKKDKRASKALFQEALTIYEKYPHLTEQAEDVRQILAKYFRWWQRRH
jgi:TPR repeat protein